jgi:hypothetical protein
MNLMKMMTMMTPTTSKTRVQTLALAPMPAILRPSEVRAAILILNQSAVLQVCNLGRNIVSKSRKCQPSRHAKPVRHRQRWSPTNPPRVERSRSCWTGAALSTVECSGTGCWPAGAAFSTVERSRSCGTGCWPAGVAVAAVERSRSCGTGCWPAGAAAAAKWVRRRYLECQW